MFEDRVKFVVTNTNADNLELRVGPFQLVRKGNYDLEWISELSRNYGLIPEQALREVYISRAFTCYQMMSLISDRLEEAVKRLGPEFIVITGLPSLFSDLDLPEQEALIAFDPVVKSLKKFLDTDVAILLTSSRFGDKNEFTSRLESISDHVIGPEGSNPSLRKNGSSQTATRTPSLKEFA